MTAEQWESLCDGCGLCCLEKFKDHKTGKVYFSDLACPYLDLETCTCTIYHDRLKFNENCTQLSPESLRDCRWLPKTCAYRRLSEGKDLPAWHPLKTGEPESVHVWGHSLKGRAIISARDIPEEEIQSHILSWQDLEKTKKD